MKKDTKPGFQVAEILGVLKKREVGDLFGEGWKGEER